MSSPCPERRRLEEYAAGRLPEDLVVGIQDHVNACSACDATLNALELASDTMLGGLKQPPRSEPYADEAEYRRAAAQAQRISQEKPQSSSSAQGEPARHRQDSPKAPAPQLGPYKLLAKLGEGGMGAVYKAQHEHLEKIVAIKVLPRSAMNDKAAVDRFRREMKAVGRLHHPNIVTAHDAGEARGVHYLVMEYVEGSDLSSLVKKQGPLPVEKATSYVLQAARGLAFAHSKGIIHRDIKPANLLVDSEGTVKILDMGLARREGDTASKEAKDGLTQTGQVMGTVDYMAPEQAFDTHRADAKADVYSLGCTLYRILAGKNAFDGDTLVQKILAHRENPVPPLASPHGPVSDAVEMIYRRMMGKRPDDRPTMAEVVKELEALQAKGSGERSEGAGGNASNEFAKSVVIEVKKTPAARTGLAPLAPALRREGPGVTGGRDKKPPLKLIAAGLGGFALVFFGIWITIRDKDGKTISQTYVPDDQRVEVTQGPPPALAAPGPSPSAPPGLVVQLTQLPEKPEGIVVEPLNYDGRTPLTIEGWFNTSPRNPVISGLWLGRQESHVKQKLRTQFGLHLWHHPGKKGRLTLTWTNAGGETATVAQDGLVRPGTWQHLAAVYDLHELRLYVDGKLAGESIAPKATPIDGGFDVHWHGQVDELSISKSARYVGDFTPPRRVPGDADTLALYHFDEGRGDTLADASRNSRLARIVGGKWVPAVGSAISPANAPADPLRAAAEYVLARKGRINGTVDGKRLALNPDDPLPAGALKLEDVHWNGNSALTPADFARLQDLPKLRRLFVNNTAFDDSCIDYVDGQTEIQTLWIDQTRLTPTGTKRLLDKLPSVTSLNIGGPFCTDDTLTQLHGFKQLASIAFMSPSSSTPAGIAALQRALPNCKLTPYAKPQPTTTTPPPTQFELLTSPDYEWSEPVKVSGTAKIPAVSGDGLCLVSVSSAAQTVGGNDLWIANRATIEAPFGMNTPLGPEVNSPEHDSYPWLSADGLTLIFGSERPGGQGNNDLWMTTRSARDAPFGPPTNLGAPVNTTNQEQGGALSADGRMLVFASTRSSVNGVGDLDLWQCRRTDAQSPFEKPVNLGPAVNSAAAEQRPWLSADGRVLYFGTLELANDDAGRPAHVPGTYRLWTATRPSVDAPFGERRLVEPPTSAAAAVDLSFPTVSADGTLLFFRARPAADEAAHELWMSRRVPKTKADGVAPPPAVAPFDAAQARAHQEAWAAHLGTKVETQNSVGTAMVLIPPGEFLMGSRGEQIAAATQTGGPAIDPATVARMKKEQPQHRVVLTKPLRMSAAEVSIGAFKKFAAAAGYKTEAELAPPIDGKPRPTYLSPGVSVDDNSPAVFLSWNDAVAFCHWLTTQEGTVCRLPTEAEWEFACRAGTTTQFWFGDDPALIAEHTQPAKVTEVLPAAVGPANPFGLWNLHDARAEWCQDNWGNDYSATTVTDPTGAAAGPRRVQRNLGGVGFPALSRSAYRGDQLPTFFSLQSAFRVVQTFELPPAVAPFDAAQARAHQEAWAAYLGTKVETPNSVGMKMVLIPPGEFLMGSTSEDIDRMLAAENKVGDTKALADSKQAHVDELPQHRVRLTRPFVMAATESTRELFQQFADETGYRTAAETDGKGAEGWRSGKEYRVQAPEFHWRNPGYAVDPSYPVGCIAHDDAVAFCNWLNTREGLPPAYARDADGKWIVANEFSYRLPTEAEWEFACRAGTTTRRFWGDEWSPSSQFVAASQEVSGQPYQVSPVARKQPNPFGLYDMLGNVNEICNDKWSEDYSADAAGAVDPRGPDIPKQFWRVIRSGTGSSQFIRSPGRGALSIPTHNTGFRVVRTLEARIPTSAPRIAGVPRTPLSDGPAFELAGKLTSTAARVRYAVAAPDGVHAALAVDYGVQWKELATDELVWDRPLPKSGFMSLTISPDGRFTAGGSGREGGAEGGAAYLLRNDDGTIVHTHVTQSPVYAVAFSPDGTQLAVGLKDGAIQLLDVATWTVRRTIAAHTTQTRSLAFSGDGSRLASGSSSEIDASGKSASLKLWKVTDGAEIPLESTPTAISYFTVRYLADGRTLAMGTTANHGEMLAESGKIIKISNPKKQSVRLVAALRSGTHFILAGNHLQIVDQATSKIVHEFADHPGVLESLDVTPDGRFALTVLEKGKQVEIWRLPRECWTPGIAPTPAAVGMTTNKTLADPAFQAWLKATQALPAEKQIEAVSKKLMELNPGFDGKLAGFRGTKGVPGTGTPKIDDGVVTELALFTDHVTDLAPLRALSGLHSLRCTGSAAANGLLTDLSPLAGMPLLKVEFDANPKLSDLSALRGMKLTSFSANYTAITQETLLVLQGMSLTYLHAGSAELADLSFLKGMPLEIVYMSGSFSDLSPLRGMPLRSLSTQRSQVTDLSPLKGMPLSRLGWTRAPLSDLSPLSECKDLVFLHLTETKVTAEQVATLKKALPKCEIKWDGPAKAAAADDRAVAERIIELGGSCAIYIGNTEKSVAKVADLGDGPVRLTAVLVHKTKTPTTDADLRLFADCHDLHMLNVDCSSLSAAGLDAVARMPKLQHLGLFQVRFAADDLAKLQTSPSLRRIDIRYSDVQGKLTRLNELPNLDHLYLGEQCRFTAADLVSLRSSPKLTFLSLVDKSINDQIVPEICEWKQLANLELVRTRITRDGVKRLQAALPKCKITVVEREK